MGEIVHDMKQHRLVWAIALSSLVHLLFLVLMPRWEGVRLFAAGESRANPQEKRIAFEIVETPEDARTDRPPESADLASDKNARARDRETRDLPDAGLPFSEGLTDAKEMPRPAGVSDPVPPSGGSGENAAASEPSKSTAESYEYRRDASSAAPAFSRNALLGQPVQAQPASGSDQRPTYNQQRFSAEELGGFSLNTYAWNFAPYLLELKRRIQGNIYPPPAFTRLGFGGENVLRFRIYPDGRLEGPEILDTAGEKALVETSSKAVQLSAPFYPLPDDFPEPFLQVTARFQYFILEQK